MLWQRTRQLETGWSELITPLNSHHGENFNTCLLAPSAMLSHVIKLSKLLSRFINELLNAFAIAIALVSHRLSMGCISPRYIYEQIKKYERERTANESTYWCVYVANELQCDFLWNVCDMHPKSSHTCELTPYSLGCRPHLMSSCFFAFPGSSLNYFGEITLGLWLWSLGTDYSIWKVGGHLW